MQRLLWSSCPLATIGFIQRHTITILELTTAVNETFAAIPSYWSQVTQSYTRLQILHELLVIPVLLWFLSNRGSMMSEGGNDIVFAQYTPTWKLHRKIAGSALR